MYITKNKRIQEKPMKKISEHFIFYNYSHYQIMNKYLLTSLKHYEDYTYKKSSKIKIITTSKSM